MQATRGPGRPASSRSPALRPLFGLLACQQTLPRNVVSSCGPRVWWQNHLSLNRTIRRQRSSSRISAYRLQSVNRCRCRRSTPQMLSASRPGAWRHDEPSGAA